MTVTSQDQLISLEPLRISAWNWLWSMSWPILAILAPDPAPVMAFLVCSSGSEINYGKIRVITALDIILGCSLIWRAYTFSFLPSSWGECCLKSVTNPVSDPHWPLMIFGTFSGERPNLPSNLSEGLVSALCDFPFEHLNTTGCLADSDGEKWCIKRDAGNSGDWRRCNKNCKMSSTGTGYKDLLKGLS